MPNITMAGFGRSDVPGFASNLVADALGYGNFLMNQRRLGLAEQTAAQQATIFNRQQDEYNQQQAILRSPVSVKDVLKKSTPWQRGWMITQLAAHGINKNAQGNWANAQGGPVTVGDVQPFMAKLDNHAPTIEEVLTGSWFEAHENAADESKTAAERADWAQKAQSIEEQYKSFLMFKKGPQTPNPIELARGALRIKLGREPNDAEVSDYIKKEKIDIGQSYRNIFQTQPFTQVPGVWYKRKPDGTLEWYKTEKSPSGEEINRRLTSDEVKAMGLQYQEQKPTETLKTMGQIAPTVTYLAKQVRSDVEKTTVGPLAGRWKDAWAGKVGAADPNFMALKTDVDLLRTLLMKMHVGSRGGEYIMNSFKAFLEAGKQSPENLKAALDRIESYAGQVSQGIVPTELKQAQEREAKKGGAETPTPPPTSTVIKYDVQGNRVQ